MNWKITLIPLVGILLAAAGVKGQSAAFLEVAPDARAAGLGEAGTALPPDAWSVYWNVAGAVAAGSKMEVAYSFTPWMTDVLADSRLHRAGGFYRLSDKDAVVAGFRCFTAGKFELLDEHGVFAGEVNPMECAAEIGYARSLYRGFSAGAAVRYIRSDMGALEDADPADAVAFDLGLYYRTSVSLLAEKSELSFGLTLADLGSRIKYGDSEYALPTRMAAGAALTLPFCKHHTLLCAANAVYRVTPSNSRVCSGGVGVEYGLYKIGFLRAGYRWNDMEKNGGGIMSA